MKFIYEKKQVLRRDRIPVARTSLTTAQRLSLLRQTGIHNLSVSVVDIENVRTL